MPRNPAEVIIYSSMFKEYHISFDGVSYNVKKKGVRNKLDGSTEEKEDTISRHPTLDGTIDSIVKDKMISKARAKENKIEIIALEAFINEYRSIKQEIRQLLAL